MAAYFLDTSALVKRYIREAGSNWIGALTDPAQQNDCWISDLTRVELLGAIHRRARSGAISAIEAQAAELVFRNELCDRLEVSGISGQTINRAMDLVGLYPLRAYDSLQLAVAVEIALLHASRRVPPPVFVSADVQLNQFATLEGLTVDNPNDHP